MLTLLLGAGFGAGAWCWWLGLRPPRPPLSQALKPRQPIPEPRPTAAKPTSWAARLGGPLVPALQRCHLPGKKTTADLRTLAIPVEQHLAEKAAAAIAGLLMPWPITLLATLAGTGLSPAIPLWAGALLAALLFLVPDMSVRQRATRYRADVRHALSTMLDLTVVSLSGGAGVEQALTGAANAGHGPAFRAFRQALREADILRTAVWGPLSRLGDQLAVAELPELAAAVALAGTEGAKIKTSLASKAATLRGHLLAEAEAEAASATERMSLPVVMFFAAFLLLIGYPALAHALSGL